jgi:hypothetical protein
MHGRQQEKARTHAFARALAPLCAALACLCAAAPATAAAPSVTIGGVPALNKTSGTFSFQADGPARKLQCRLDSAVFSDCVSPVALSGLSVAAHTFRVRAIGLDDSIGVESSYSWTIDVTDPPVPSVSSPADNWLTNFPTPTFSGTAEPFARVPLFDGSLQLGEPHAAADGRWSFTPVLPLADGAHQWRVRAIDGAGNLSGYSALRTLRIDTVPPTTPTIAAPAENAELNTRTPLFTGTIEPHATVAVSLGAVRLCSTSSDAIGAWACVSTVALADGVHTLGVVARDAAGNESPEAQRTIEIDATPPPAPTITAPADGFATAASGVTVSGAAEPLARVKLLIGTDQVAEEIAAPDGSWSHSFDPLAEGDYAFSAREVDTFNNWSAPSNVVNVRLDRTPPNVAITGHPQPQSNLATAAFVLTADEPLVSYECSLDGAAFAACSATPSFGGLGEGAHSLRARDRPRRQRGSCQCDIRLDRGSDRPRCAVAQRSGRRLRAHDESPDDQRARRTRRAGRGDGRRLAGRGGRRRQHHRRVDAHAGDRALPGAAATQGTRGRRRRQRRSVLPAAQRDDR